MTYEEQLAKWVEGESVHMPDQCCPDFSCCNPRLQQPKEVREAFAAADERTRFQYLLHFLAATFPEEDVYIAGTMEEGSN